MDALNGLRRRLTRGRAVTLQDQFRQTSLHLQRTVALSSLIAITFLGLLIRLFYLQVLDHEHFSVLARNNQMRLLPLPPARGLLFDRNGLLLADNRPVYSLEITPFLRGRGRAADLNHSLEILKTVVSLSQTEMQAFEKQLKYRSIYENIPLKLHLTESEMARILMEKYRLPGVEVAARLIRHYPRGERYAHVLGYVGPMSEAESDLREAANYKGTLFIGKTGLEKFYEAPLHGRVGMKQIEADAKGRLLRVLDETRPVAGENLVLSIDDSLQALGFELLSNQRGSLVAFDPNNGEILALVSQPSFDPNWFAEGITYDRYQQLVHDEERPLLNRVVRGLYPPASTVKTLVALKALALGVTTPESRLFDPGWFQLKQDQRVYRDWIFHKHKTGHGWVDLEKALAASCDTYFWNLGLQLGIEHLSEVLREFGFGDRTGIDLAGELKGLVPDQAWKRSIKKQPWFLGETLNTAIGQGYLLATPIQVAQMTQVIANGGQRRTLHLRKQAAVEEDPVNVDFGRYGPYWSAVVRGLVKAVHDPEGTVHRISHGLRYTLAAKSGTAQVFSLKSNERYDKDRVREHLRDHAWMTAFAPANAPRIGVVILLENNHSSEAKDMVRRFLDAYFDWYPEGHEGGNDP